MYKTVIKLGIEDRRRFMNEKSFDAYTVHRLIYGMFPIERNARFTFDAEHETDTVQTIVCYSDIKPETAAFDGCEYHVSKVDDGLLDKFKDGGRYPFEICINPVKKKDGHCVLVRDYELGQWMERKMNAHGMSIEFDDGNGRKFHAVEATRRYRRITPTKTSCHHEQWKNGIPMHVAQCRGWMRILDRQKFLDALVDGIGREKSFGLGMLKVF